MQTARVTKSSSKLLTVWVPTALLPAINRGVSKLDTDKSKFVRQAIREKLARAGIIIEEAA